MNPLDIKRRLNLATDALARAIEEGNTFLIKQNRQCLRMARADYAKFIAGKESADA